jgi:hypothetical protein
MHIWIGQPDPLLVFHPVAAISLCLDLESSLGLDFLLDDLLDVKGLDNGLVHTHLVSEGPFRLDRSRQLLDHELVHRLLVLLPLLEHLWVQMDARDGLVTRELV